MIEDLGLILQCPCLGNLIGESVSIYIIFFLTFPLWSLLGCIHATKGLYIREVHLLHHYLAQHFVSCRKGEKWIDFPWERESSFPIRGVECMILLSGGNRSM